MPWIANIKKIDFQLFQNFLFTEFGGSASPTVFATCVSDSLMAPPALQSFRKAHFALFTWLPETAFATTYLLNKRVPNVDYGKDKQNFIANVACTHNIASHTFYFFLHPKPSLS